MMIDATASYFDARRRTVRLVGAQNASSLSRRWARGRDRGDSRSASMLTMLGDVRAAIEDRYRTDEAFRFEADRARADALKGGGALVHVVEELRGDEASALRGDAATGGLFLARELEHIYARVVQEKRKELSSFRLFPTDTSVPPGAAQHTVRREILSGDARVFRGASEDVPTGGVKRVEESFPVRHLVAAVEQDIFSTQAGSFAGFNELESKTRGSIRAIDELHNLLNWHGSEEDGLYGVLTYPWLDKVVVSQSVTSAPNAATFDAILAALKGVLRHVETNHPGVVGGSMRHRVATSPRMVNRLSDIYRDGSDQTLARRLMDSVGIEQIQKAHELQGINGATVDGWLVYSDGPDGVQMVQPQGLTSLPMERRGWLDRMYMYKSTGGVMIRDNWDGVLAEVTFGA